MRAYSGLMSSIIRFIAIVAVIYHLCYVLDVASFLGITWFEMPARAGSMMFILILTLLLYPARKTEKSSRVPWYDILLIVGTVVGLGYTFFFAMPFMIRWGQGYAHIPQFIMGLIVMIVVFETSRRMLGRTIIIIVLVLIFHTLFAEYFPGPLMGKSASISELVGFLYMSDSGLFGTIMGIFASIIMMFLLFSQFLLATGAGEFFINLAMAVAGRFRGGPAKVAVVASGLLGTMEGSPSANVAAVGVFTIPLMKKMGYEPKFAAGVEAVASTGAAMAPPVMAGSAFIMCQFLGIPYGQLIIYAAIPAVLYYLALFIMVDLEAGKKCLRGMTPQELPQLGKTLKDGWMYLIALFALIYFLVVARELAELSAVYALVVLIIISFFRKKTRMNLHKIGTALEDVMKSALVVGVTCALAGILVGSLGKSGLGVNLAGALVDLAGGNLVLLVGLTAITSFVMSMGMPSVPIYIMLALTVAPALVKMGVLPIAAHLFIYYWGHISFITPPLAVAAYVAGSIAGTSVWETGWTATRLGIVAFIIPIFIVFAPSLILIGPIYEIVLSVSTAILGAFPLSAGVIGFGIKGLNWPERIILLAGGILLMLPNWIGDIAGLALIAPVYYLQLRKTRKTAS